MPINTLLTVCLCLWLTGCAAFMAGNRSVYRGDVSVIQVGVERTVIESILGPPDSGELLKAIYKLDPDAHQRDNRNAAVVWHVVADIFTLGLWEIIGTPLEMAAKDQWVTYIIRYTPENRVASVEVVK